VEGEAWAGEAFYRANPGECIRRVAKSFRQVAMVLEGLLRLVPVGPHQEPTFTHALVELNRVFQMMLARYGWQSGLPKNGAWQWSGDGDPPKMPEHFLRGAGALDYLQHALDDSHRNPHLTRALAEWSKAPADNKADNPKKKLSAFPRNHDVLELARFIKRGQRQGRSKIDLAREFAEGNETRAKSLLRELRRYPLLLE
jgi:hypothetical protein